MLKRSKTSDPSKGPLRQKEMTAKASLGSTLSSTPKARPVIVPNKSDLVAKQMEDRRKDYMKTLTRHLEVCDLLDMRNPQSVSEYAPCIYRHLH